jgi:ADP-heptose:LPS heptosyltransferase
MLLTTPLIAHLRSALPGATVSVLASEYCGWVVRDCPDLAHLWTYPRLGPRSILTPSQFFHYHKTFSEVRAADFDVAISAGGEYSPRAIRKALATRARRVIAYAPRGKVSDALDAPRGGHEMDRMLALAAPLGVPFPEKPIAPRYRLPVAAQVFAKRWLDERGLAAGGFVVLGLGARRAVRQPSTGQVLRWSARWREKHGLQTVFMWTPGKGSRLYPGDDGVAAPVLAAERGDIHPFRGPIPEALGLIWQAAASVFPDSGLMHFAAASPGGVVGLFAGSPSWPEQWAPRGPRARWLLAGATIAELTDAALFAELQQLLLSVQGPSARRS